MDKSIGTSPTFPRARRLPTPLCKQPGGSYLGESPTHTGCWCCASFLRGSLGQRIPYGRSSLLRQARREDLDTSDRPGLRATEVAAGGPAIGDAEEADRAASTLRKNVADSGLDGPLCAPTPQPLQGVSTCEAERDRLHPRSDGLLRWGRMLVDPLRHRRLRIRRLLVGLQPLRGARSVSAARLARSVAGCLSRRQEGTSPDGSEALRGGSRAEPLGLLI